MHVQCVLLHKIYYANLSECTHKHILNVHRNVYFTRIRIHYVRTIKCVPVQQTIENIDFVHVFYARRYKQHANVSYATEEILLL